MWRTLSTHHPNQRLFSSKISWISWARIRHRTFIHAQEPAALATGGCHEDLLALGGRCIRWSFNLIYDGYRLLLPEDDLKFVGSLAFTIVFQSNSKNITISVSMLESGIDWMGIALSNTKIFQLLVLRIHRILVAYMLLSCRFSLELIPWNSLPVQAWRPRRHARGPHLKPVLCGAAAELQRPRVGMWCPPVMFAGS